MACDAADDHISHSRNSRQCTTCALPHKCSVHRAFMRKNHEAILLPAINSIVDTFAEMSTLFDLSIISNKGSHTLKIHENIGINEVVHFKS